MNKETAGTVTAQADARTPHAQHVETTSTTYGAHLANQTPPLTDEQNETAARILAATEPRAA